MDILIFLGIFFHLRPPGHDISFLGIFQGGGAICAEKSTINIYNSTLQSNEASVRFLFRIFMEISDVKKNESEGHANYIPELL